MVSIKSFDQSMIYLKVRLNTIKQTNTMYNFIPHDICRHLVKSRLLNVRLIQSTKTYSIAFIYKRNCIQRILVFVLDLEF